MKKVLVIVLFGFIAVSILTVVFTIQVSNTFQFEDDNGDNGNDDDSYDGVPITILKKDYSHSTFKGFRIGIRLYLTSGYPNANVYAAVCFLGSFANLEIGLNRFRK